MKNQRNIPFGAVSSLATLNESTNDALDTSHATDNVYSSMLSVMFPAINFFFPDLLNAMPFGPASSLFTLKESTNDALDTSHAIDNVYSFTSSPCDP